MAHSRNSLRSSPSIVLIPKTKCTKYTSRCGLPWNPKKTTFAFLFDWILLSMFCSEILSICFWCSDYRNYIMRNKFVVNLLKRSLLIVLLLSLPSTAAPLMCLMASFKFINLTQIDEIPMDPKTALEFKVETNCCSTPKLRKYLRSCRKSFQFHFPAIAPQISERSTFITKATALQCWKFISWDWISYEVIYVFAVKLVSLLIKQTNFLSHLADGVKTSRCLELQRLSLCNSLALKKFA